MSDLARGGPTAACNQSRGFELYALLTVRRLSQRPAQRAPAPRHRGPRANPATRQSLRLEGDLRIIGMFSPEKEPISLVNWFDPSASEGAVGKWLVETEESKAGKSCTGLSEEEIPKLGATKFLWFPPDGERRSLNFQAGVCRALLSASRR